MRWITINVEKLLSDCRWNILKSDPGGDYDTKTLYLSIRGSDEGGIWVAGFRTEKVLLQKERDDAKIEMVEVSDRQDSRGGLNSEDEDTCVMYGIVCSRLRKAGFQVVPRMDDYF